MGWNPVITSHLHIHRCADEPVGEGLINAFAGTDLSIPNSTSIWLILQLFSPPLTYINQSPVCVPGIYRFHKVKSKTFKDFFKLQGSEIMTLTTKIKEQSG